MELHDEWATFAPAWIRRMEQRADAARVGLLDDWMLAIIGDVAGLEVVDLGCGEGRFCRTLAAQGARTLGVDLQAAFVDYAEAHKGQRERYLRADIQALDGVGSDQFDLAISYISLVDVPDQQAAVDAAFRVLAPGGRFVVCSLSPMATAPDGAGPWLRDESGAKVHYVLDDYTREGPRQVRFDDGHQLTNFHRMLSSTVNGFLDAGFELRRIHEPVPNPEQAARVPANLDLFRVPIYTIYDLRKPAPPPR